MALVLIGAVADFAESVEENGAAKRILLLTLVEADVAIERRKVLALAQARKVDVISSPN